MSLNIIVTGSDNTVGQNCSNVAIFNSSGCTVLGGLSNVMLMNSSGVTVTENNKVYINNAIQSTASIKKYVALITQSSTSAPTVAVLENTIGDIVWTRIALGIYEGTLSDAFTASKTFLIAGNVSAQLSPSRFYRDTANAIRITTESDGQLSETSIEVIVYE